MEALKARPMPSGYRKRHLVLYVSQPVLDIWISGTKVKQLPYHLAEVTKAVGYVALRLRCQLTGISSDKPCLLHELLKDG